eukprot:TRINITY_DN6447_c0_g1_i2.p1 TRINITY_DN6447_c0_g1~~TRINITY_DN6447_c0_g1_i2.p1  ORF type:complete len:1088 (-),score=253.82 TRINITY_DN6447_c0_g1_i2:146-3409(-)
MPLGVEGEAPHTGQLDEARPLLGLASLPRLSRPCNTPSLQRHFWSWSKQSGNAGGDSSGRAAVAEWQWQSGSDGGGGIAAAVAERQHSSHSGSLEAGLGIAMSTLELRQRRPHLTIDGPPSTGPPPDRRSDLKAEHDVSTILDTVRIAHSTSLGMLEVPHGLRLDRRVRGMDFLCSSSRSASMMAAGKDEDRLRAMAAAGFSESPDGRLEKSKSNGNERNKNRTDDETARHRRSDEGRNPAAYNQEQAEALMRSTEFFLSLESASKGIIKKLASKVTYRKEKQGQVIFRQHDPPGGAWVVVSGKVGVFVWKGTGVLDEPCPTPRAKHNPNQHLTLQQVEIRKQQRHEIMKAWANASLAANDDRDEVSEKQAEPLSPIDKKRACDVTSRWQAAGKKALRSLNSVQEDGNKRGKWKGSRNKILSLVRMQGSRKQAPVAAVAPRHEAQKKTESEEAEQKKDSEKKNRFQDIAGNGIADNGERKATLGAGGNAIGGVQEPCAASLVARSSDEPWSPSFANFSFSQSSSPAAIGKVQDRTDNEKEDPDVAMRRMQEESGDGRYKTCENYSTFSKTSVMGTQVAQLASGSLFGELALQNSKLRNASIVCIEESKFVFISHQVYDKVMKQIMDKAQTTKLSKQILMGTKFCQGLEASSPGITEELARECRLHKERKDQVLFRQGDPPRDCYVVAEGKIDIFIFKEVDADGKQARLTDRPTPRREDDPKRLNTISQEYEHFKSKPKDSQSHKSAIDFQLWGKGNRYSTTEGNSAFGEESKYGEKVATLTCGAVVGELALQNNKPRAATVQCSTDCVFLVISKDVFQRVLRVIAEKTRFFNANLPGLAKLQYREDHPSVLFQRRVFPAGYEFLFEGIFAIEPALLMLFSGSVEFRRCRNSFDNFAYFQGRKPLVNSKPLDQVLMRMQQLASPTTWTWPASQSCSHIICDVSGDAEVFCTMPFLPMAVSEPFTVVAASNVEAYHIGGSVCDELPPLLVMELREHLIQKMEARLRRWLQMRESFMIRGPAPQGSENEPASILPTLLTSRPQEISHEINVKKSQLNTAPCLQRPWQSSSADSLQLGGTRSRVTFADSPL